MGKEKLTEVVESVIDDLQEALYEYQILEDETITSVGFNVALKVFVVTVESNKEIGVYTVTIDEVIEELAREV